MVLAEEAVALHSIPTNISISSEPTTRSKVSTVPELSLKSSSTVSSVSHKSHHLSKAWCFSMWRDGTLLGLMGLYVTEILKHFQILLNIIKTIHL